MPSDDGEMLLGLLRSLSARFFFLFLFLFLFNINLFNEVYDWFNNTFVIEVQLKTRVSYRFAVES